MWGLGATLWRLEGVTWLSINSTLVKTILEDRPTLIELLSRCVGKYLGGQRILHSICVGWTLEQCGWAGICMCQSCCVPPGTFSPWRLRYREADRCSLPTIAENRDERNEKWNVMICQEACTRGFVCSHYQSYLLWKRYSSLDRFSWYPINVLGSLRRWHGYYCLLGLYDWSIAHMIFAQIQIRWMKELNVRTMLW